MGEDIILAFPLLSIIVCFIGAVLCSFSKKQVAFYISLIVCMVVFALSLSVLIYTYKNDASFIYTMGHFGPNEDGIRICNEIRFGPLEGFLATFFAFVLSLCILGGKACQDKDIDKKKHNLFFVMMCLILVSNISLIYTNDIFTGFVFLELSTLASCGCLMVKDKGPTILSCIRYMIFNLVGSGLFLLGIIIMYNLTGYLSIENIASSLKNTMANGQFTMPYYVSFSLIVTGLSIKSGVFPFHFWMPDAYGCATSSSSSIVSGIVTKGYILLLIKVICRMFTYEVISNTLLLNILFVLGVLSMIIASINAIHQTSIDRMIAFSSAAQIGYIFMGIGIGEEAALIAAIFHILTHAITKPLLFISSEHLSYVSNDSKKFKNMRGCGRIDIISGICFSIGALSMVGIPLFAGFISKYLFVEASLSNTIQPWMEILALIALLASTLLNTIYFLRTMITIYLPYPNEKKFVIKKYPWTYLTGVVMLSLLNLFLGVGSSLIMDIIKKGIELFY
ncbi:MAG: hypothetical protein MR270_01845 [Erysipelotrichaceae bacterium]|nr:hypothetical protein [Erysipelotrichaceae bacterium]